MKLSSLFLRCLNIGYTTYENGASFAIESICDSLYIYFEHSNGIIDWKNNLDFPKRCGECFCYHRGFLKVWNSIKDKILKYIKNPSFKKIYIVGYSHGAALALLCYEMVYRERKDIRSSLFGYGFGCPRVLWGFRRRRAKAVWENFLVIRNIDDIVTHLHFAFLGYFHVGKMLKIGARGRYSAVDAHRPESILAELYKI
jgi:hypothetical protein